MVLSGYWTPFKSKLCLRSPDGTTWGPELTCESRHPGSMRPRGSLSLHTGQVRSAAHRSWKRGTGEITCENPFRKVSPPPLQWEPRAFEVRLLHHWADIPHHSLPRPPPQASRSRRGSLGSCRLLKVWLGGKKDVFPQRKKALNV